MTNRGIRKNIDVIRGAVIMYAAVSAIVKASSPTQKSCSLRVLPFHDVLSKDTYTYDKGIDNRLKFITADVSNKLKDEYAARGDISWDTLQGFLLQNTALRHGEPVHAEKPFAGKFTEPEMKTWLNKVVKECDTEISDALRINDPQITEVIQFVANQSVGFSILPKSVSNSTSLLDIGMIRFPTKDNPYVKLYRLQLTGAFSGSSHIMPSGGDETRVLTATVDSCNYYPNDIVLQRINPEYVDKTIARFEDTLTA